MSLELSLFETRLVNLSLDNGEFGQRLPKFFVAGEIDLLTPISSEGCICSIVGGFHLVNCILSLTNFTNNELQNSCGFEQGKDCYIFLPCIHIDNSNPTNWYKHMSCKLATRTTAGYTTSKVPAECYIKICVEQVLHSVPRINNYTLMNKGAARPYA